MATSTSPALSSVLPDPCTCHAARCSTRWNAAVCSGSWAEESDSRVRSRYSSSSRSSALRSAPQARSTSDATLSFVIAWSRCSSVTYSCRRRRASPTAFWRVCCRSLDTVTIAAPTLLRLERREERVFRLPRERHRLLRLRLRDLVRIDTGDAHPVHVNVQHDAVRALRVVVEDRNEDPVHELLGREVVVVEENLEERGPPRLLLGLGLRDRH